MQYAIDDGRLPERPSVCLNMIVKNEAHIIHDTLTMLCSKIQFDYWVICDTGSTDATREIVQDFFSQPHINIPGELRCDAWVNFAHNRTLALGYAFGKTDLLLVFDADDDLCGTITMPSAVTHDEYQLKFGSPHLGSITYARTLLINNRKRFQYHSVVHEYISCMEPSPQNQICVLAGDYYVVSGRGGARNQDPDKYLKDALLLESAYAEAVQKKDPLHKRYAFYCANSYRDHGKHEDAIRWYKITLTQDNWAQEKYMACLHLHRCYESLGQKEHGFFYLVKAFAYDLERVECLYPLVMHYCCEDMNEVAYGYYRIVQAHYERAILVTGSNDSKLFLESDKANFFLPYYMIIVADRVGDRACGIRMYEIIFTKKYHGVCEWHLRNLFFNLRFFIGHVKTDALSAFVALANEYLHNGVPPRIFDDISNDFDYARWGIGFNAIVRTKPAISANFSRSECVRSKVILFYAGYSTEPWNYSGMKRGALGGSEKAVAHLANELAHMGYTVCVSGGVQPEKHGSTDETGGNVKYVGLSDLPELLRTTAFHTIICSRYVSFLELYGGAASFHQFYVWAHDTHLLPYGCDLSVTAILEKWADHIDGCVCQTRWHADEYARNYPVLQSKIRVINNGIDASLFPSVGKKVPNRFIYTSRTERGLKRVLDLWSDIMASLPDATLVISTYVPFPCNDDEREMQARIAQLNDALQSQCIRHLGQLNPTQLYSEMGAAEYWLYPTDWPETSCITAMEMLMSHVICMYYPVAGLTDTMGGCGIQIASGSEVETLRKIASDDAEKVALRQQGRAYAESCGWANRAQQWVHGVINGPNFKTVIINLKRRDDRKVKMEAQLQSQNMTDYEFMDAVDGNQLIPTETMHSLFKGNDFNYRKGVIGCAMSHLALWKRLMHDSSSDVYVVMEDDAELVDRFEFKLHKAVKMFASEPSAELCFISGFSINTPCTNADNMKLIKKNNNTVDGLGGYLIKKSGAIRFIDYYNTHSMKRAIDASIVHDFNEHLYELNEHLIKSPFFGTDTDIQKSFDVITFRHDNNFH